MKQAVIDTSVLISWYKLGTITGVSDFANIAPVFSIITQIEALGFQGITAPEVKMITRLLNAGEVIYLDRVIAQQTIDLRQLVKIKTPDAIIAATALARDIELWTANTADFSKIKGLKLYNPLQ